MDLKYTISSSDISHVSSRRSWQILELETMLIHKGVDDFSFFAKYPQLPTRRSTGSCMQ